MPHSSLRSTIGLFLVFVLGGCANGSKTAEVQIRDSLAVHGGLDAIEKSGLTVRLTGEFDLSTRLQGRSPNKAEPTPINEILHIGPEAEWLIYDLDWFNYVTSNQVLREVHLDDRQVAFVDPKSGQGGYLPRETVFDHIERFTRYVPQLFLEDALQNDAAITEDGLTYVTNHGQTLVLSIDPVSKLLQSASTTIELPVYGNSRIDWVWHDYTKNGDIFWPSEIEIMVNGRRLKKSRFSAAPGPSESIDIEDIRIDLGPPPNFQPYDQFVQHSKKEAEVEAVSDGVYLIRNLRPGFTMMFIDIGGSIVAIDAPADWFEMNQIPPLDWSQGMAISGLGDKYIRAIRSIFPEKPISHLVLTHHHSDHIGGLAPFVAEGAEIVGGPEVFNLLEMTDNLPAQHPRIQVDNTHILEGSLQNIELISLPDGNPKADGYLMVYLPRPKTLYTAAFIYPVPEAVFPPPESISLSKYFVSWLDSSGLDIAAIYNVHGNALVEDWHLEKIRNLEMTE